MVNAIGQAINTIESNNWDPYQVHEKVASMYSWHDVAKRTDDVYQKVMLLEDPSLADRFEKYSNCGPIAGKFGVMIIAVNYIFWLFLEWFFPRTGIDIAPTFDPNLFHKELIRLKRSIIIGHKKVEKYDF